MSIHKRKRKKGTVYVVMIRNNGTKQFSKTFSRLCDAEQWETQTKFEVQKDLFKEPVKCNITTSEIFEMWRNEYALFHLEKSSQVRYERYFNFQIKPDFERAPLRKISRNDVEAWYRKLRNEDELSVKSVNEALSFFKRLIEFAMDKGFVSVNPARAVKMLRAPEASFQFWAKPEATQFLQHAARENPRLYPIFLAALTTGMRLGEIIGLKWDAVCMQRMQIEVKRTWCLVENCVKERTKTKKIRMIPINSSLLKCLREQRLKSRGEFVFERSDGTHLATQLRMVASKARVNPIRFHDLRHSFASQFMMAGGSIYDLQKLLGHTSIQMTERYSHLSPLHLIGKTDCMNFEEENFSAENSAKIFSLEKNRRVN